MLFNLYDKSGKYQDMNLLNVNVNIEGGSMSVKVFIADDFEKAFGDENLFGHWLKSKEVIKITLERVNHDLETYSEKNQTRIEDHIDENAPNKIQYVLSGFYVYVRDHLAFSEEERNYFKGMGHNILCWILCKLNKSSDAILLLNAYDGGTIPKQKKLVQYYEKIGFETCVKTSNGPYDIISRGAVCMYSPISSLFKECKNRFRSTPPTPFLELKE